MALLTLAELIDEAKDQIPSVPQAKVVRAVNKVIRRLNTELVEPTRSTFTTKAQVTTGTVAVTQGSTTATFSSGVVLAADPIRLVQISGDRTWFVLTRNAADTAGILSSAWAEATDATATYTIVYPTISFPLGIGEILKISRGNEEPLGFTAGGRCPTQSGRPVEWSPYVHDETSAAPSDDLTRIFLNPAPEEAEVFSFWYKPRATFLATDAATTVTIPLSNLWYEPIVLGTLAHLWRHESDKDRALVSAALFEQALERARSSAQPAAVIDARNYSGRFLYGYERRPITEPS